VPASPLGKRARTPLQQGMLRAALRHGIDVAAATVRLGGHVDAYRRLAQAFDTDLRSLPDRLDALLSKGDRVEACRLLHGARGIAATLGMTALSAAAAAADRQLADAAEAEAAQLAGAVRAAAETAHAGLAEVIARLAQAGPREAPSSAAASGSAD
jgi:HPt (histidine-containing phosphotransfer) domain-containing protein